MKQEALKYTQYTDYPCHLSRLEWIYDTIDQNRKSGETVKTMFNDMFEEGVKPEMTLVDTLLVELSEISKKVASIGERLKTLKH